MPPTRRIHGDGRDVTPDDSAPLLALAVADRGLCPPRLAPLRTAVVAAALGTDLALSIVTALALLAGSPPGGGGGRLVLVAAVQPAARWLAGTLRPAFGRRPCSMDVTILLPFLLLLGLSAILASAGLLPPVSPASSVLLLGSAALAAAWHHAIPGLVRRSPAWRRRSIPLVLPENGAGVRAFRRSLRASFYCGYRALDEGGGGDATHAINNHSEHACVPSLSKSGVPMAAPRLRPGHRYGARWIADLPGSGVLLVDPVPAPGINGPWKRATDILGALVLLAVSLPLFLLTAAVIAATSGRPIFHRHARVTRGHKTFTINKFRTMRPDAEPCGPVWSSPDDPRRTRIGRILRHLWIDELPQLINVLRGDMSLVGPRPERPEFTQEFEKILPKYVMRHTVRAGLTGLAQVSGFAGSTSIRRRLARDLHYIRRWTPWYDLALLAATMFRLFVRPRVKTQRFVPGRGDPIP